MISRGVGPLFSLGLLSLLNLAAQTGWGQTLPVVSASPSSLSFAGTVSTTSPGQVITITNGGTAVLMVSRVSIGGTHSTQFLQQSSNCGRVSPGASCSVIVAFRPSSTGTKSASLSIAHNAIGSPTVVTLTGLATALAPVISLSPQALSFNQAVNTTSEAQVVTIRNTGTSSLFVSRVSLSGSNVNQFSQTNTCSSVPVNGSCTIRVIFRPTSSGSKSALIAITHNAPGTPSIVTLSGTGVEAVPILSVSPPTLSFSQLVGVVSAPQLVTLSNTGNAPLVISRVSLAGSNANQFSQTNACSQVGAGASCSISVRFAPSTAGTKSASLSIVHNAAGSSSSVLLSGSASSAAPIISISPPSLDFTEAVNATSQSKEIVITNLGAAPLSISKISLGGTHAPQFLQTNNCSSVAVGRSCKVDVAFRPTTIGAKVASLLITHNASGGNSSVQLTGSAVLPVPEISISPVSLSFTQAVNSTSPSQTISVANRGTATLSITGVVLAGADAAHFSNATNCSSVPQGGTCSISVTFRPTSAGTKNATVSIQHNAAGSPSAVALAGIGVLAPLISVQPTSLTFTETVTRTSPPQEVTVSNVGTAPLTLSQVVISGENRSEFAQISDCSVVVVGNRCKVTVTFSPASAGSKTAELLLSHDAAGNSSVVQLAATAIAAAPAISLTASSLSFVQKVNTLRAAQSFTVSNPGTAVLEITSVNITGVDGGQFSRVTNCASVPPGGSCTVGVSFVPTSVGSKRATVSITHNASATPSIVNLRGSSVVADFSVSSEALDFGSLRRGSISAPRFLTITNHGETTIPALSITFDGAADINLSNVASQSTCSQPLPSDSECRLELSLLTGGFGLTGRKTGFMRIASATDTFEIPLAARVTSSTGSENQWICRAEPERNQMGVQPLELNVVADGVTDSLNFKAEYVPSIGASNYSMSVQWPGYNEFTVLSDASNCRLVNFKISESGSGGLSLSSDSGACEVTINSGSGTPVASKPVKNQTQLVVKLSATVGGERKIVSSTLVLGRSSKPMVPSLSGFGISGGVRLRWSRDPDVNDYEIWRFVNGVGSLLATISGTTYLVNDVSSTTPSTFAVRGTKGGSNVGLFSVPVSLTAKSPAVTNVTIDDITINQAVETRAGSSVPLIAGKGGFVEVRLAVTGDAIGRRGRVLLRAPQSSESAVVELLGPLHHTPRSFGPGAGCIVRFDLRDDAGDWFAAGTRAFTADVEFVDDAGETTPVTQASRSFSFVAGKPLDVKLIGVNSVRGSPSSAELELSKVETERLLKSMYPNTDFRITLSPSRFNAMATPEGPNLFGSVLTSLNTLRTTELAGRNCDRFYYGLIKDNTSLGSRTIGLAFVSNEAAPGACPLLTGIGVVEAPLTAGTAAHELGHNHGIRHAPCGFVAGAETNFPYANGGIGVTGYDSEPNKIYSSAVAKDMMSYCGPAWISDHNYARLRRFQEKLPAGSAAVSAAVSLPDVLGVMVSGSIDPEGTWQVTSKVTVAASYELSPLLSRGFAARVVRPDGSTKNVGVEVIDIDHIDARAFRVWIPDATWTGELVIAAANGSSVLTDALMGPGSKALDLRSLFAVSGTTVQVLPWDLGGRLVFRIRGTERAFAGNDDGTGLLVFEFLAGDQLEVHSTLTGERIVFSPAAIGETKPDPDSKEPPKTPNTTELDGFLSTTESVPLQEIFSQRPSIGRVSTRKVDSLSSANDPTGPREPSALEISRITDPLTGSQYVLSRSAHSGANGYAWVVGYRSSSEILFNQLGLSSSTGVLWRLKEGGSESLPSTGWLRICGGRLWSLRDGYQLVVGRADLSLLANEEGEIAIAGEEPAAKLIETVSCLSEGGVRVTGYLFTISEVSPIIDRQELRVSRFEVMFPTRGSYSVEVKHDQVFALDRFCLNLGVTEIDAFCEKARRLKDE